MFDAGYRYYFGPRKVTNDAVRPLSSSGWLLTFRGVPGQAAWIRLTETKHPGLLLAFQYALDIVPLLQPQADE